MPTPELPVDPFVPNPRREDVRELGNVLRAAIPAIIAEHVENLRKRLPVVHGLEREEVVNDLADVLEDVADAFTEEGARQLELRSPAHGVARFAQMFEVEHLGVEYTLLRTSVAKHVRKALGRSLTDEEGDALHAVIDYINSRVTVAFERQKEKRIRLEADSMSRFVSALAHDLRNNLNGAMLTMQMVAHSAKDAVNDATGAPVPAASPDKLRQLLEDVEESRHVMETTIDAMTRLLEAERLRVGSVAIRPVEVLLKPLLESVSHSAWRGTSTDAEDAHVHLHIDVPDKAIVCTDYALLSTVLLNLVSNAIKYGDGKPVHVSARAASDGAWQIDVADEGPGIPSEQQAMLFQQFYQGELGKGGVGLGLFTARRAVELMGAELRLDSEVGRGSTFTILIPRDPPEPSTPEHQRVR